jgi:hypothetical protein
MEDYGNEISELFTVVNLEAEHLEFSGDRTSQIVQFYPFVQFNTNTLLINSFINSSFYYVFISISFTILKYKP